MTPSEIAALVASFAALLGAGGWLARLGMQQAERRVMEAQSDKTRAEVGTVGTAQAVSLFGVAGEIIDTLREEVTRLKEDREDERKITEELRERIAGLEERVDALQRELRAAAPAARRQAKGTA